MVHADEIKAVIAGIFRKEDLCGNCEKVLTAHTEGHCLFSSTLMRTMTALEFEEWREWATQFVMTYAST